MEIRKQAQEGPAVHALALPRAARPRRTMVLHAQDVWCIAGLVGVDRDWQQNDIGSLGGVKGVHSSCWRGKLGHLSGRGSGAYMLGILGGASYAGLERLLAEQEQQVGVGDGHAL